ncbi:MAG: ABC transporter ATP-binding protein [Planctomycetes bacterium]|nr:ABC transporter ATP-binding protein [Planctomycetota bacterium]
MDVLVRTQGLTKDFRRLRALDDVSLEIGPGVTGLLGPNGAGKTTLIKILLGLLRESAGTGEVLGRRLGREARAIRSAVGYMPEDDCYIDGLSGVEMVAFSAELAGLPPIEALRRSHEILDFCGAEQERYRQVSTYSSGMRQKVKFAQAIVHDPRLLILDEPTAGLDPEERRDMLQRIQILARRSGKAVILSTHILPDVQTSCDWVVILSRGRVRLAGGMEELTRPASPSYEVRLAGPPEALVERIRRAGYAPEVGFDGTVTVPDAGEAFTQGVWSWAREAGAAIRKLTPARNSLEEIFLETVRGDEHADS